jgi:hypothetical protein
MARRGPCRVSPARRVPPPRTRTCCAASRLADETVVTRDDPSPGLRAGSPGMLSVAHVTGTGAWVPPHRI